MIDKTTLRSIRRLFFSDARWEKIWLWRHGERVQGPLTYNQDGLATRHNCDFVRDPKFARAYALGKATGSWRAQEVHWRAYVVCWAAMKGLGLEGDFVECGTYRGGYARTVIDYTDFGRERRRFFLLDTFRGLVKDQMSPGEMHTSLYEECFEDVQKTFVPFPNVTLIRGAVPDTLKQITTDRVAFASIDMNSAAPEIAAAEFLWGRLAKGAVLVLDDYGWSGYEEQKTAFDRFAAERHVQVLPLPTGQGLIFKP
jgi:O-methyltransferase